MAGKALVKPRPLGKRIGTMKKRFSILAIMAALLLAALAASPVAGAAKGQDGPIATHIIVFNEGVDARDAAGSLASAHGLSVSNVYTHALSGMAAVVPAGRLKALGNDPRVAFVEANQVVEAFDIPTGIERVNARLNTIAAINGDGGEVVVDIAIIDTGIDLDHPDLNVIEWTNCARKGPMNTSCKDGDSGANDGYGHGTHVAGTVAARDNGDSVVGMAPGARLWAVKVLGNDGSGWMNWIVAGIDYVASHSNEIEVANMSLGCACTSAAMDEALTNVINIKGVTFVVAAGNSGKDASAFSPANHPDVITVSAIADFDGVPGGLTDKTVVFSICTEDEDDSFACFSNFGLDIDIAAPGVSILSTYLNGGTATMSGTSMASPHVAGAAALILVGDSTLTPADVRDALITSAWPQAGPSGFVGDTDGSAEPLLNVANGPPPSLDTISVTPASASVAVGNTQQFTATGTYDDASTADITADVTWTSSDDTVASIDSSDSSGLATGVAEGSVGITASLDGKTSNTAALTITSPPAPPALASIAISPASATIETGETQQFIATGTYDGGSTADITADVTWTSSVATVATIDASGLASGLLEGSTAITAAQGDIVSGTASLDVTPAPEAGSTVGVTSITYATSGGKNGDKHLFITISVADDLGNPVESASVSIKLTNGTSGESWIGTGATGAEGSVTFKLGNFPPGCYSTVVTDIIADGLTWDGDSGSDVEQQPFCKTSSGNGKGNSGALQVR